MAAHLYAHETEAFWWLQFVYYDDCSVLLITWNNTTMGELTHMHLAAVFDNLISNGSKTAIDKVFQFKWRSGLYIITQYYLYSRNIKRCILISKCFTLSLVHVHVIITYPIIPSCDLIQNWKGMSQPIYDYVWRDVKKWQILCDCVFGSPLMILIHSWAFQL